MPILPALILNNSTANIYERSNKGELTKNYSPLLNFKTSNGLGNFTTKELNFSMTNPVLIDVEPAYDGAVNLILNDDRNTPRMINSGFAVNESDTYTIPKHFGYKNTNTYDEETVKEDSQLILQYRKIPKVEFLGLIENGGVMKCGSYTFYFKLADADGNESEIAAESGIVQVFVGSLLDPSSMRMGMEDENTNKSISFKLTNIDTDFEYVHVQYARSTSNASQAISTSYHKVLLNFPIVSSDNGTGSCTITITGAETTLPSTEELFYTDYAEIKTAKTLAISNNVLYLGNIKKEERDYEELRRMSWRIIPRYGTKANIGKLGNDYTSSVGSEDNKLCYYNVKNVYYRLGYWPDEIYRFGIVYIFTDNSLSPVFNLQGIDFNTITEDMLTTSDYEKLFYNEDGSSRRYDPTNDGSNNEELIYFNKEHRLNSRGVIKTPNIANYSFFGGHLIPEPLYLNFDLSNIGKENLNGSNDVNIFKKHKIKGFFFVRQTRVPTIISQGLMISLTDKERGALPIIKYDGGYHTLRFLSYTEKYDVDYDKPKEKDFEKSEDNNWKDPYTEETNNDNTKDSLDNLEKTEVGILSNSRSHDCFISSKELKGNNYIKNKAMLCPDAELDEPTFNSIFTGAEFSLKKISSVDFVSSNDYRFFVPLNVDSALSKSYYQSRLINIPDDSLTYTIKDSYFSSLAGNLAEPYKTKDVRNEWDKSFPLDLTKSTSLVRGSWGPYVGCDDPTLNGETSSFEYGKIYNIKSKAYSEDIDTATDIDFQRISNNNAFYSAICDRTAVENVNVSIDCYRGDCFINLFTHRIMRNFTDPELPTNHEIVDPLCWSKNYLVRCSAALITSGHSNLTPGTDDSAGYGFYISPEKADDYLKSGFANEIVLTFEVKIRGNKLGKKRPVDPQEMEKGSKGLSAIFKTTANWSLRGLSGINRADINAIALGLWITFPICSNYNFAMRDVDPYNPEEEAIHKRKRSFYPYNDRDVNITLRDSNIINGAAKITVPQRKYIGFPETPFIKQEFFNRIYNSGINTDTLIVSQLRQILATSYQDTTKECGTLIKLVSAVEGVIVIFEHGIGIFTLNNKAENVSELLSKLTLITKDYGSKWPDSVIIAENEVYGVDTVAKKIWKFGTKGFLILSDLNVETHLIDKIDLKERAKIPYIGHVNVKTHYNAFKKDIIFTYYNDIPVDKDGNELTIDDVLNSEITTRIRWKPGTRWSLCYDITSKVFRTFYDWFPLESVNVDNIFFSFGLDLANLLNSKESPVIASGPNNPGQIIPIETNKRVIDKAFLLNNFAIYEKDPKYGNHTDIIDVFYDYNDKKIFFNKSYVLCFYIRTLDLINRNFIIDFSFGNYNYLTNFILENTDWTFVELHFKHYHHKNTIEDSIGNDMAFHIKPEDVNGRWSIAQVRILEDPDYKFDSPTNQYTELLYNIKTVDYNSNPEEDIELRSNTNGLKVYKHGQAGIYDIKHPIKPCNWYGELKKFYIEFIVNETVERLKIFNNLQIIANKEAPESFEFEIVGEGYEWAKYKELIFWINKNFNDPLDATKLKSGYKEVLSNTYGYLRNKYPDFPIIEGYQTVDTFKELPFFTTNDFKNQISEYSKVMALILDWIPDFGKFFENKTDISLFYDERLNEYHVRTKQKGNDLIKSNNRTKGNMHYKEDIWKVEIRPISIEFVHLENGELKSILKETRLRDKYMKCKIVYPGDNLATIKAVATLFNLSYA